MEEEAEEEGSRWDQMGNGSELGGIGKERRGRVDGNPSKMRICGPAKQQMWGAGNE